MGWKAGFGEADITPPIGIWLNGFGGRTKPCDDIHDPLLARALVLENEKGKRAAIVALDLMALTDDQVTTIRQMVQEWTGISPQNLLLNCSHTHAGPVTLPPSPYSVEAVDPAYLNVMMRKVATAVKLACNNLQDSKLFFGTAGECRVAVNRGPKDSKGRAGPIDPQVSVLVANLERSDFSIIAFSYSCHPTVLKADNYAVTADFVHYARQSVEDFFGGQASAMFLQGCFGDIGTREWGTFEIAQKLGRELATSAVQAVLNAQPVEGEKIDGVIGSLKLPLLPPPSAKYLREYYKQQSETAKKCKQEGNLSGARVSSEMAEWAKRVLQAMRKKTLPTHEYLNAQVLRIGSVAFAALGSETFVEIGLNVKSRSPLAQTVVLGCTNGYLGYLPTAKAYGRGGYEVNEAFKWCDRLLMHGPESERIATNWLLRQLNKVAKD